jgi:hypothetical protein
MGVGATSLRDAGVQLKAGEVGANLLSLLKA